MKVISVNVGKPQPFSYQGKEGYTSIFKSPVEGERKVSVLNIEGDAQADLTVHGGEMKAVYAYDISYYYHWENVLKRDNWDYGLFGENLTTEGLPDQAIYIGNIYRVGSVILKAVQPRFPCFKLNIRFGWNGMVQQFMQEGKHGTYFSVVQEGTLRTGDAITLLEASRHEVTVQRLVECYYNKGADRNVLEQILAIEFLPGRLRAAFESYL